MFEQSLSITWELALKIGVQFDKLLQFTEMILMGENIAAVLVGVETLKKEKIKSDKKMPKKPLILI